MTQKKRVRSSRRSSRAKAGAAKARVVATAKFPTRFGRFIIYGIRGAGPADEAVAIQHGKLAPGKPAVVRIHSQCLTGDVFGSERCDCRAQLELSLRRIAKERPGIVLYLAQEGRGIGLINKIRAYQLQDRGFDTVEANRKLGFAADHRDYDFAAAALKALGARSVRLLSNNPEKVSQLESNGIRVVERIPCQPPASKHSRAYLQTKKKKMGHLLGSL